MFNYVCRSGGGYVHINVGAHRGHGPWIPWACSGCESVDMGIGKGAWVLHKSNTYS